jgi:soluble lytic murein transglycosylase
MSFLRVSLLSTALITSGWAAAQTLPGGLSRSGDVVMMQPIPDGATGGTGLSGPRPSRLRVLSAADHDLFVRAFEAATRGDWIGARGLAAQAGSTGPSATARRLLEWRYALDRNSGATFAEIDAVMRDTGTGAQWPLRATLQARAEDAITPDMAPSTIVAWFAGRTPNSSIGKIRLGEALIATGERTRGAVLIRAGWAEGSFDTATELAIVQQDGTYLTPESDRARLDNLLWRGETTAARRQMSRVDSVTADIANARIALTYGLPKAQAVVDKMRDTTDPGLLFDWSRQLRLADRDSEAHAMLLRVPSAPMVRDHAARWWAECNVQARDALSSADPRTALALASHAGFSNGDQYADQQFLTGFIALRFVRDPTTALASFQRLDAGVSRPISKSRAQYWQGRAYEALGDTASALTHYRQAASYPETFYGQIAIAHTDAAPMLHLSDTAVEAASASDAEATALMPEIRVLADLGQAGSLRAFIDRTAEANPSPRALKRLMILLNDWGYPEIAVRLAKTASYTGTFLPTFSHPVIAIPAYQGPGTAPDPALVLGLIRQETEFDTYAVSGAGARGLMQMMPASAKTAAKAANLAYRPEALLTDTAYNMQLGMTEYRGHLDRYGGSYVLAAASYNAGPNNARKWIAINGDPRNGGVDPIDWIEQIPFGETRNYVQRVLENTEVYRARLAGRDVPLRILPDLYAPLAPSMPVLAAR